MTESFTLHTVAVGGLRLQIADESGSRAVPIIAAELDSDAYGLRTISFCAGDIVIDVGGHVGLFSIYLASLHPEIRVHSFEPFPRNHSLFLRNLERNPRTNIVVHNIAITADGRKIKMASNPQNSGGATSASLTLDYAPAADIPSITLDNAFDSLSILRCKLLKIDCEGLEHEILLNTKVLVRTDHLRVEFHMNTALHDKGYSFERVVRQCLKYIPPEAFRFTVCGMSE